MATPATPTVPSAHQIAQAVSLHLAPDAGKLTIQLQPGELGAVEIRIERPHGQAATVSVTVEKPETLHAIQQDLPRLHQALDRAGIPPDAPVSLHLAPPADASGAGLEPGTGGRGQNPGFARNRRPSRSAITAAAQARSPPAWFRAGINITA